MSDKSVGFFSSVGRFFTGGSGNKSKESEKSPDTSVTSEVADDEPIVVPSTAPPAAFLKDIISVEDDCTGDNDDDDEAAPQSSRIGTNLRYLSPSALDRNPVNGLEIDVEPVPDIFFSTPSVSTNRKRQLTELDRQILPQTFRSDSVKRSRFLNRSLLEPTLKSSLNTTQKLDTTWCGELSSNHSPASSITNFSLLSRRSGATTNGSLSTRTQEIYNKLQGANTPAKEIQRLSMLRGGLTRPERWAPVVDSSSSSPKPPPPLKKAGDAIPSRIQLVSKTMGLTARRTPYWRDLTRKRGESKNGDTESTETQSLGSLNGNLAAAELSSLFAMDPPAPKKTTTTASTVSTTSSNIRKAQTMKGSDGKSIGRNTFKLTDDDDKDDELLPIEDVVRANAALKRGFLENLSFTFSAPVDVLATATIKTSSIASSIRTSVSKSADSESDVESNVAKSSSSSSASSAGESGVESDEDANERAKESRPVTSADTISSAESSKSNSKDSSPKTPVTVPAAPAPVAPTAPAAASSAKWECQSCFTSWEQTLNNCGCCGEPRDKTDAPAGQKSAEKQLVSNLASFASSKPSGSFSFGFGAGSSSSTSTPAAKTGSETASKPPATSFGFGASTSSAPAAKPLGASASSTTPSLFGASTPAAAPTASEATSSTSSGEPPRVDWSCPDCFVSNKATDDKCPCCNHRKYTSSNPSSNVFGNRAFKPLDTTSGAAPVAFGVGGAAAKPPAFGFGTAPAPAPVAATAPASTPAPVTSAPAPAPAPVAAPAPAPAKPFGFGLGSSSAAAPEASAAKVPETVPLQFTGSLFGKKTGDLTQAAPAAPAPAPAPAAAPTPAPAPAPTAFGSSTTSNLFAKPATTEGLQAAPNAFLPRPAEEPSSSSIFGKPASMFGTASTTNVAEPAKPSLFGGVQPAKRAAEPSGNLFGAPPSTSNSLFAPKPASESTTSIFGKPFGGDIGATTTDGGIAAKRPMFSSTAAPAPTTTTSVTAPKLSFGGDQPAPAFGGFGTSTTTPAASTGLFGAPSAPTAAAPSLFGSSSSTTSIPAFGATSNTAPAAPPAFGAPSTGTISFGGAPSAAPAPFGGFGTRASGMSASSSTNSLFGQNAPDTSSNPFASTGGSNGFNFGGSSGTSTTSSANNGGGGIFQFGASQPAAAPAPSGGAFQFGGAPPAPAPGSMDNAFAYQASAPSSRKMALARRRNTRK